MPATRSKVAASISRASRSPSSIRLRLVLVTVPDKTLLAHEADAAAEAGESLLLELVGRVRGVSFVLDFRVHLVIALEEFRHAQLLFAMRPPVPSPLPAGEARRLRVRNFSGGRPRRTSPATCRSGLSKVATTIPSTSAVGSSEIGRTGSPRKCPPPSPAKIPTGS